MFAINVSDLEAQAIACEANSNYLGANKLYHEAMKVEALKPIPNKMKIERLRREALNAYHAYEIQQAERELL